MVTTRFILSRTMCRKLLLAIGTYEWVVIPFGLKNVEATYQRVMTTIFHDLISKIIEVYIDDVVVKSTTVETYLSNLK